MILPRAFPLLFITTLSLSGAAAWADVFELVDGGEVSGLLLARGENEEYVIRTDSGAELTLEKSQVRKVSPVGDNLLEYRQRSRTLPDTVEAHRALAQWCKEHELARFAEHHHQRILQLDPSDEEARKSLGYQEFQGRWLTRDQIMALRGMRMYDGDYRTEQDIALREREKQRDAVETDWFRNLRTWRGWLDNERRAQEALALISQIQDPVAAPAIVKLLDREEDPQVRSLLLSTLGELRHPAAVETLVVLSLDDPDPELRQQCLDHLLRVHQPITLTPYVKALKSPDNEIVLRAAEALERIGDPAAISPLIDALVTTHKYDDPDAAPGGINASFSPTGGGGGFAFGGGGDKIIRVDQENSEVRMALVALSGGQDFQYNEKAWRRWYVNEQIHDHLDARRDE
jgi:HEAT repeat protein